MAGLSRSDLKQRLEAMERELAAIHNPGRRKREHDYFLLSDEPKDAPTLGETDIPVQYMVDYMENTGNLSDFLQGLPRGEHAGCDQRDDGPCADGDS